MTHAMPTGPCVQVATRSSVHSVRLARTDDDSFVGVLPLGARNLISPSGETLAIESGRIPDEDKIEAIVKEILTLASSIP